jgi:asparagine synthase (glutamine-hydrolysing)
MCGICGIYSLNGTPADQNLLMQMTGLIRHRGPDDEGYCLINTVQNKAVSAAGKDTIPELQSVYPQLPVQLDADLALGFRRLSILDLSPLGHQPMSDAEDTCWIVFNGEIYNYLELRAELEKLGYLFKTHTDTEVILNAYKQWGIDCQQRFTGMWAFALYDLKHKLLFCSRDRYGIKPFYYTFDKNSFCFGSEIKQLLPCLQNKELNYPMLWRSLKINALLAYGEDTFFTQINALRAGHYLIIKDSQLKSYEYDTWHPESFEQSKLSFADAVEQYRSIFLDSVKLQMRSDVEVGSCLSGGMDSSAIVCTAAHLTDKPFQTFSSYYGEDKTLDERQWIKLVAEQTRAISHLVSPTPDKTIEWFENATWHNDLPVGAGFVSQFAVMQLAKEKGVKVLLDGQGSDELTAGYNHAFYRYFADLLRSGKLLQMDRQMHAYFKGKPVSKVLSSIPKILMSALLSENTLYNIEFSFYRFEPFSDSFQSQVSGQLKNRRDLLSEIKDLKTSRLSNFLYNMMNSTSIQTLLHYEDRMAMAHGVESRVPFLDHRLVELAFSLPSAYKINPPFGKYVHREAMQGIIPAAIYNRKDKAIFSTPFYSSWMQNNLKDYISDIFASDEFKQRGIYNLPIIKQKWKAFRSGSKANGEMLFNILALEIWLRTFKQQLS